MKIIPIELRTANDFIARHHRHNKPVRGCKFVIGLLHGGLLCGVAVVGRPVARRLQDGLTAEVTRVCVDESAPKGACSKLYAACQRAWFAMGGIRIMTYTLQDESGASLRGAGWHVGADCQPTNGWSCPSRPRRHQKIYGQAKLRWESTASHVGS